MKSHKNIYSFPKNWISQIGVGGKKIGVLDPGYGLEKVSYGLAPDGFNFVKVNRIPVQKLAKGVNNFATQCPFIIGGPIDLMHTFNMLPLNKDFVLTSEMELPRFFGETSSKIIDFGFKILQSDRCRGIYSLSEAGKLFAQRRFQERGLTSLADRVKVFRGGFDIEEGDLDSRPKTGPIKACFVGVQMFRKGIEPVLDALQALRDGGVEIELTLIGEVGEENYVVPDIQFDKHALLQTLEEKRWIKHHRSVPHSEVLSLFRRSHILVFPSMDETLGWVPVEAGFCSMPRLTTNIFAFPELIKHEVDGWLIDLPLNADRRWAHIGKPTAKEAWFDAKAKISQNITEILGNKDLTIDRLIAMGRQARINTNQLYNHADARNELVGIYNSALR